uniref:Uncharacterized protein n=1 Tax=Neobodo designis TaxID=312471 RepID=A0A7S1QYK9_NEODS
MRMPDSEVLFAVVPAVLSTVAAVIRARAFFAEVFSFFVSVYENNGDLCKTAGLDAGECQQLKADAVINAFAIAIIVLCVCCCCPCCCCKKRKAPGDERPAVRPGTPRGEEVPDASNSPHTGSKSKAPASAAS